MSQLWKQIERRGVCHYPDVSSEYVYIVSVDSDETLDKFQRWIPERYAYYERFRGKTCFMAVFDEPSAERRFMYWSSPPFPTVDEAARFAEEKIPTGIIWEDSR